MSRRPDGRTVRKEFLPAIRVTPKFKAAVEKKAAALEKTITDYVRDLIIEDLKK